MMRILLNSVAAVLLQTFVITIFSADKSHAQFNTPVTTTIKTPYGNVNHTYYVHNTMRFYQPQGNISVKHNFYVVLKNDSAFDVKTRIDISEDDHTISYKKDRIKRTLRPEDTKTISRITSEGHYLLGIAADSCWLFKINFGKINSYSFLAEEDMNTVIAIQKGDGPIVPLKKETLHEMVGEDLKLLKLIEKNKFVKVIQEYNKLK